MRLRRTVDALAIKAVVCIGGRGSAVDWAFEANLLQKEATNGRVKQSSVNGGHEGEATRIQTIIYPYLKLYVKLFLETIDKDAIVFAHYGG